MFKANKDFKKTLKEFSKNKVVVGFEGSADIKGSTAQIAMTHEFGSKDGNIPARPFLRQLLNDKNLFDNVAIIIEDGGGLRQIEDFVRGQAKKNIYNMDSGGKTLNGYYIKPLKEETVREKGSDAVLRETSTMVQSIKSEIRKA